MTTQLIKQRLHTYLELADDKKVKAIYTMMENEISKTVITKELKAEMDERLKNYKTNTSTALTEKQSKKRINNILNSAV